MQNIETNKFQTTITEELLNLYPQEVQEQFFDYINGVDFIKWLISPDRPYAKDCPRDTDGRIIVDLAHPHIVENMDYFRQPALHFLKYGCYTNLRPNSNPHSEYRKFWEREIDRSLNGYVRESDGEWVTGYCYWFLNYNPMMVNIIKEGTRRASREEAFPFFFEGIYWRFHYLEQARLAGKHAIELARRGAHPYEQIIYTPDGVKTFGELKVGDKVFGTYNNIATVIDIPYDSITGYYKLTLADGREVLSSGEHLWNVGISSKRKLGVVTVNEMVNDPYFRLKDGLYKYAIPLNLGVEYSAKDVPIDPYTFGVLLGDGTFKHTSIELAADKGDIEALKNNIPYETKQCDNSGVHYTVKIDKGKLKIKELGLSETTSKTKFIPELYKYNSREVRLAVLQGLMDTDGWASRKRSPQFCTISETLKDDVLWLARSLGYKAQYVKKNSGYRIDGIYVECSPSYIITICGGEELFRFERKKKIVKNNNPVFKPFVSITKIEYIDSGKCKCIEVDSEDGSYLIGDFITTHNCAKSYTLSAMMTRNLILGLSNTSRKRTITTLVAYQKEYLKDDKDGTFSKFKPSLNFLRANTPFPRLMLKNSPNEMSWQMGYKDDAGIDRGSFNSVIGVSAKDDPDKCRGKRSDFYIEEMGTFSGLLAFYDTIRKGVEDGNFAFNLIFLVGTANESESDFSSAKVLLYNPDGYNLYAIQNVFDKKGQGKANFGFFFPAYINRAGCYNKDGVSDVVKALLEILMARYKAKYSADPQSVLRVVAEDPITPAEAIIKVKAAYFPVAALTEALSQLDQNPNAYNDVYVGELVQKDADIVFRPTADNPIHAYGVDNSTRGAIEIFEMPERGRDGKIFSNRYIVGHDPVDNDQAESHSLSSTFVFDLFTDRIVAEYTGRQPFADDNFEIVRKLCLFYNARCLYEAHAYSELVPTPTGFRRWEDIKVGDTLFSPTKGTVKVIDIPVDTKMPIYKVTLADGRVITASDRHIWSVYYRGDKELRNLTTEQLMKYRLKNAYGQHTIFLPEGNGVEYEDKSLPIDPYTMGLILSEGSIRGAHCTKNYIQISSSEEDMKFYERNIPYESKHIGSRGYSWHVNIPSCKKIMQDLKLYGTDSHTKFIPEIYKLSNRVQRMNLLQGIMDGDGHASEKGASLFITVSERLATDVMSLARSLGIKAWLQNANNGIYRVCLASFYKIFKLPRKVVNQHVYNPYTRGSKASAILLKTAVESIEFSHYERGKCVTVDSEDGLYYINDYVITHNSNKKGIFAYFAKMNCTHYLAETPEYLREKQLVKYNPFGSNKYGVNASAAINDYANGLLRDWLLKPITIQKEGEEHTIPMLYTLRNRALLEELIAYTPELNVDRIRAMGMVMLYRQEKIIMYQGNISADREIKARADYLGNDKFFSRNYDLRRENSKFSKS